MKILALLFSTVLYSTAAFAITKLPVNDSHIFYTPENWLSPTSVAVETSSPGAYLKVGFTGTSFGMIVDTSSQMKDALPITLLVTKKASAEPAMTAYSDREIDAGIPPMPRELTTAAVTYDRELPKVGYQVDGGAIHWRTVASAAKRVSLLLVTGLPAGNHQIKISLEGLGKDNRWNKPSDHLKITEFDLDDGATAIDPILLPKRLVVYGDSITEGDNIYAGIDIVQNKQWSESWDARLADRLNAEVSVIACQGQGYNQEGAGGVPQLSQSFNYLRDGVKRRFSKPDEVVILEGTNGDTYQGDIEGLMEKFRSAYPDAKLFFTVPFNQRSDWSFQSAFQTHWKADPKLHLVDLGSEGSRTVDLNSFDKIHPNSSGHALLGEQMYRAMYPYLEPTPTPAEAPAKPKGN